MVIDKDALALQGLASLRVPELKDEFGRQKQLLSEIVGAPEADLERQRDLSQAQALFDVARLGLAFAAPTKEEIAAGRRFSPAERLAQSARDTKFFESIGARAADLEKARQADKATRRAFDLKAFQAATKSRSEAADRATKFMDRAEKKAQRLLNLELERAKFGKDSKQVTPSGISFRVVETLEYKDPNNRLAGLKRVRTIPRMDDGSLQVVERKDQEFDYQDVSDKVTGEVTVFFRPKGSDQPFKPAMATIDGKKVPIVKQAAKIETREFKGANGATEIKFVYGTGQKVPGRESVKIEAPTRIVERLQPDGTKIVVREFTETGRIDPDFKSFTVKPEAQVSDGMVYTIDPKTNTVNVTSYVPSVKTEIKDGYEVVTRINDKGETSVDVKKTPLTKFNTKIIKAKNGDILSVDKNTSKVTKIFDAPQGRVLESNGSFYFVDPDKPGDVKTLFEAAKEIKPSYKIITDKTTNLEQIVDVSTSVGRDAVEAVSAKNKAAGKTLFAVRNIPAKEAPPSVQMFVVGNETVLSYDKGRTYVDSQGQTKSIPPGAIRIADNVAYNIREGLKIKALAGKQLKELDKQIDDRLLSTINTGNFQVKDGKLVVDPNSKTSISASEKQDLLNAFTAVRDGTGPYAALQSFLSNSLGGLIPLKTFGQDFGKSTAAKQYLRTIVVLGRSALVINPRFPVAEMANVAELFANPDIIFTDPANELQKLVIIKRQAVNLLRTNLKAIKDGIIKDDKVMQQVQSNNFEIRRLLQLMESIPTNIGQASVDSPTVKGIQGIIRNQ